MSTLALDDQFNRANGAPGNNWTDVAGANWSISSQQLTCINTTLGETNPALIQRPANEVTQNGGKDQLILWYVQGSNSAIGSPDTFYMPALRIQNSNTYYYMDVDFVNQSMSLRKLVAGVLTNLVTSALFAAGPGTQKYIIMFAAQSPDASHTTLTAKIWNAAFTTTPLATLQLVGEADTNLQAAGVMGANHAYTNHAFRFQAWNYDGTDPSLTAYGIFMPTPAVTAATATSVSLTASAASGGTGPYTYQWYRSSLPDFTPGPGTILSGQTSLSITDSTVVAGTLYYYKVVATDTLAATGTSSPAGAYTVPGSVLSIGGIGDSIMANIPHDTDNDLGLGDVHLCLYNPFKVACRLVEKTIGLRVVKDFNQALPGTTSGNWAPASLNLPPASYALVNGANANVGPGNLLNALLNFASASPPIQYVLVMLGANDSRPSIRTSQASYQANVQSLCNALIGNGYTPVVNFPTWIQPGSDNSHDETSMNLATQYITAIKAIVNGSTILAGDWLGFYYGANNVNLFEGSSPITTPNNGVHPNQDGGYNWGEFWGMKLAQILGASFSLLPAMLVTGTFFFSLKKMSPVPITGALAAYMPSFVSSASDSLIDSAGLVPPYSLAYMRNLGNQPVVVKDGVGGKVLANMLPGAARFLRPEDSSLGKNKPAISGVSRVEYAVWD